MKPRVWLKQMMDVFFPHSWGGSLLMGPGRSTDDYASDVGHGLGSSSLMAPIQWIMRAWPEARLVVRQHKRGQAEPSIVENHPLTALVRRANDFYSGEALWMASVWSWCLDGNAYWRVVRTRGGAPQELWWVPFWQINPVREPGSRQFISHYEYRPEGQVIRLDIDQVVHFRHSINPYNTMLGVSPIASVLREVWTDDESTNWIAAILRNSGVPGLIITPRGDAILNPDEVERVKAHIESRFTGDQRGRPMALGAPTDVHKLSYSPNDMDMTVVHNTAEERVCAVLGLPAAVVGFGTGLENSKVGATMREFVGLAWSNGIIPPQRIMAGELQRTLVPAFEANPDRFEIGWDYSSVAAMQEDAGTRLARYDMGVKGGWIKVSEARAAMGLQTTPEDEIYLRLISVTAVDPDDQLPEPLPEPTPLRALPGGDTPDAEQEEDSDEEEAEEARYAEALQVKQGTLEELVHGILARRSTRINHPPRWLLRVATRMERDHRAIRARGESLILPALHRMGVRMSTIAREVLQPKQSLSDLVATSIILERAPIAQIRADFTEVYIKLYEMIASQLVVSLRELMDLEPLSEVELQQILRTTALERVNAMNLSAQFRGDLLQIFERAQQTSMTEDQLMAAIQEKLPAGRWREVSTRARIIARTESRYGQNVATSQWAQRAGLTHLMAVDARLGITDEICTIRNGMVVSTQEANVLSGLEHPSGTLGFIPLAPSVLAGLGVTV